MEGNIIFDFRLFVPRGLWTGREEGIDDFVVRSEGEKREKFSLIFLFIVGIFPPRLT